MLPADLLGYFRKDTLGDNAVYVAELVSEDPTHQFTVFPIYYLLIIGYPNSNLTSNQQCSVLLYMYSTVLFCTTIEHQDDVCPSRTTPSSPHFLLLLLYFSRKESA